MPQSQNHSTQQQPANSMPITVESLSEFWFLAITGVAVIAYLVKLELGVKSNREQLDLVANAELPKLEKGLAELDIRYQHKLEENHRFISTEIQTALLSQQNFLSSQVEIILEKLNSRDAAIANLKEQLNRQGNDIREIEGHLKYQTHHHPKRYKEADED